MQTVCFECGKEHYESAMYSCEVCGSSLLPKYPPFNGALSEESNRGIWRYHKLLPSVPKEHRLYLGEGMTPLIPSVQLGKRLGIGELYFKYEGGNPTGSYKDRIAALGVSRALAAGKKACIGTSSGNAGASIAAYAARAGMPYHLFVLEHMAEAKLAQVLVHKAKVRKIKGFGTSPEIGDEVFRRIFESATNRGWEIMITAYQFNPYAMEGVKTISFEIFEQLNAAPTHIYSPAGGGGLYCGIWKGFHELQSFGAAKEVPQTIAVQSAGCSNIARAYAAGSPIPAEGVSTSMISGLQVPNPPDGRWALKVMASGGGKAITVEDESIWEVQKLLAEEEGIFCEPAAAASVAGLIRDCRDRRDRSMERIVCIISGSGFKDIRRLTDMASSEMVPSLSVHEMDL
ncbi:threonine synthase [Paenibacillus silviterrae]|uniref:threonine synthase n=1 Tax=Paenibacillus silviterrae TaxID=3242194 RepID=UPI002542DEB3|nr:pyridoxal-phosphate dependent enzyme [Paenibacillus chinjuensis]